MSASRLLVLLLAWLTATWALAADLTVFAAASLKEALDAQVKQFQSATGRKVVVAYAASSTLAKQIESGAPAHLFIAADLDWMDYVERKGLVMQGTRIDLLRNRLVLVAPAASKAPLAIAPGVALAAALGAGRLAMANPDSVPAGKYGKSALEFLGVWRDVDKHVARAENVRAALALVSRGEAPLGIVYATDAHADKGVRIVDTFPEASHPPIVYPAAVLASSKSPAATQLLDYLRSPPARAAWKEFGFTVSQ